MGSILEMLDFISEELREEIAAGARDSLEPEPYEIARDGHGPGLNRKGLKLLDKCRDEDPDDRSPIALSDGPIGGRGQQLEGGVWQLVVMLPQPHPDGVIMPRERDTIARDLTGDAIFDRRFTALVPSRITLRQPLRELWCGCRCDWLYAEGTLTTTLPRFLSRHYQLAQLTHGLGLAKTLIEVQSDDPATLLEVTGDSAWRVAVAALDLLLQRHPGSAELVEAYRRVFDRRGRRHPRLRVHALRVAGEWDPLLRFVRLGDRGTRSDAFEALLRGAPSDKVAAVAEDALGERGQLDVERTRWVVGLMRDDDPRVAAAVDPDLRERFLAELVESDLADVRRGASELLRATGTATAYRILLARGPDAKRSAALAAELRERLTAGALALTAPDAVGGLSIAEPEPSDVKKGRAR